MKRNSVFISHNWGDKGFARRLADDLMIRGVKVWIDEGEIKLGDSLIEKIRKGIDEMDYLAVVISPESVESEWVKKEVDIAMNQEIEGKQVKVLPLLYRQCELPGFLKGKLYADFTSEENYQEGLMLLLQRLGLVPSGGELFIYRKDRNGIFTMANDAFANAEGADIVGKSEFDLYPKELAQQYRSSDWEVIETGKAVSHFEHHVGIDGTPVSVQVIKHPYLDEDGNIAGVEGIFWFPKSQDEETEE